MNLETRPALDVAHLPTTLFLDKSLLWWGILLALTVESTVFVLMFASLFYLRLQEATWPPWAWSAPKTIYGTVSLAVILLTAWPQRRIDIDARRLDRARVIRMLVLFFGICAFALVIRAYEFIGLQVKWDSNAYGSIIWGLLTLHTVHFLTSVVDTGIIAAYVFNRPLDPKHALDLHVGAVYWYFVVFSFIPVYILIYFGPYLLNS
jgi:heme/copper-type cytochrome/quinol oxidase subunit 3